MRKSVEHLGPMHNQRMVEVAPDLGFYTCPEFEARRFEFMEPLLREHALIFPRNDFPDGLPRLPLGGRCFDQAAKVAALFGLIYCEGIIVAQTPSGPFRMPHAWCCLPDGTVVDPTAHKVQHREEVTYVGVPLKQSYVWAWKRAYGFFGLLDGHPHLGDSVGVYHDDPSRWLSSLIVDLPRWNP